jgi:hypothetical protein
MFMAANKKTRRSTESGRARSAVLSCQKGGDAKSGISQGAQSQSFHPNSTIFRLCPGIRIVDAGGLPAAALIAVPQRFIVPR